jgi:RHS repeat-associated protein
MVWYNASSAQADEDGSGTVTAADLALFEVKYNAVDPGYTGDFATHQEEMPFGRAGYRMDPVASYYHVRHRASDPANGQWLTRDPMGFVDGGGVYGYVARQPATIADPAGLKGTPVLSAAPEDSSGVADGTWRRYRTFGLTHTWTPRGTGNFDRSLRRSQLTGSVTATDDKLAFKFQASMYYERGWYDRAYGYTEQASGFHWATDFMSSVYSISCDSNGDPQADLVGVEHKSRAALYGRWVRNLPAITKQWVWGNKSIAQSWELERHYFNATTWVADHELSQGLLKLRIFSAAAISRESSVTEGVSFGGPIGASVSWNAPNKVTWESGEMQLVRRAWRCCGPE